MRPIALLGVGLLLVPMASSFSPVASALSRKAVQAVPSSPIFVFEANDFWLNLHHFLYLLGRAHSKAEAASREAVAGAPAEAERGLTRLTAAEQRVWAEAVTAYSMGVSQLDAIRGTPLPEITAALAQADDASTLAGVSIETAVRDTLERAAPVYRKVWWSAHRASNQAWRTSIEKLVAEHGRTILDFITRAYGLQWPAVGFPVHASPLLELGRCVFVCSWCARHRQQLPGKRRVSWPRRDLPRRLAPVGRSGVQRSQRSGEANQGDGAVRPAARTNLGDGGRSGPAS